MGCFDTVLVPCPKCGKLHAAQSKGGECAMRTYSLAEAPQDVLSDVSRHAPFVCGNCGCVFDVELVTNAVVRRAWAREDDE